MEHGLRMEDIIRKDRQNFSSAQRFLFPRVRTCLEKLRNGHSKYQIKAIKNLFGGNLLSLFSLSGVNRGMNYTSNVLQHTSIHYVAYK